MNAATEALARAIKELDEFPNVKPYDRAIHVKVALRTAGFRIVKIPDAQMVKTIEALQELKEALREDVI